MRAVESFPPQTVQALFANNREDALRALDLGIAPPPQAVARAHEDDRALPPAVDRATDLLDRITNTLVLGFVLLFVVALIDAIRAGL